MNWTKETPTVPGWYWQRARAVQLPRVVEFIGGAVPKYRTAGSCQEKFAGIFIGEWLGPIEPPEKGISHE